MVNNKTKRNKRNGQQLTLEKAPVHRICRSLVFTNAMVAADSGYGWSTDPSGSVPDWSDFQNLFDQYRVGRVQFTWVCPRSDVGEFPTLVYTPDWNDVTAPTLNQVLAYEGAQVVQFSETKRSHSITFTPKARLQVTAAGAGGGVSDMALTGGTWGHTNQSLQWCGLRYFLVNYNSTSNATAIVSCYAKIHFEFKNAK